MAFNLKDLEKLVKQTRDGMQAVGEATNSAPVPTPAPVPTLDNTSKRNNQIQQRINERKADIAGTLDEVINRTSLNNAANNYFNTNNVRERQRNERQFIKDMTAEGYSKNQVKDFVRDYKNNNGNPVKSIPNKNDIDKFVNPEYKMNKYEERQAKSLVNDYFEKNPKAKQLLQASSSNANRASKIRNEMTEAERKEFDKMSALMNKTSNLSAYTYGMMNIMPFGNTAMDKLGELMGGDPEYNYSALKQGVKTQSPGAFTLGDMTSKLAAYNVLGGALEEIPWLGQATNAVGTDMAFGNEIAGKAIGGILRGNIADLALDTLPTEIENYQNGMGAKDIAIDALKNEAANTVFNAFGELPSLVKDINAKRLLDAKNAEEAEYLQMIEDDILKNTDNAVNAPARNDVDVDNIDWGRGDEIPGVGEEPSLIKTDDVSRNLSQTDTFIDNKKEAINAIKEQLDSPNFKPITFRNKNDWTFIIHKSTRPDSKWQLSRIRDTGLIDGHSLYKSDEELIKQLEKLSDVKNANFSGSLPKYNSVTIGEMLANPNAYTYDDFARALQTWDHNADAKELELEDIIYGLSEAVNDDPELAEMSVRMFDEVPTETAERIAKESPTEVAEQAAKEVNPDPKHWSNWKVGDEIDHIVSDEPGIAPHRTRGVVSKVEGDHAIVDVDGGEHLWVDDDTANLFEPATKEINKAASDDKTEYWQKLLNDKKFLNKEVKKAMAMYKSNGMEMDSATVKMELEDLARRNLKNADVTTPVEQVAKTTDGYFATEAEERIQYNLDRIQDIEENAERYQRDLSDDEIAYIQKLKDENYRLESGSEMSEADEMMLENNIKPAREMATEDVNPNEFANDIEETVAKEAEPIREEVPVEVPKAEEVPETRESGLSQHIRGEGKMQMKDVPEEVVADFESNPQIHDVLKNKKTLEKAEDAYANSSDRYQTYRHMLEMYDPAAVPFGQMLAKDYSAQGQHEIAAQIYRDMAERLTKSGQFSQAAVLAMTKDDPLAAMHYAEKEIDAINRAGKEKFGNKWKDFKLTDEEMKAFGEIKPGDEDAIKKMYEQIGTRIGKEYPSSLGDKILELRRVAMLLNPRTMLRNVFANVPTEKMRWISDRVDAVGENIAHLINPKFEVTQSLTGSGLKGRSLAKKALESDEVQNLIKGTPGKYEEGVKSFFMDNKQVFKGTALEKWLDNASGKAFNKAAEVLNSSKRIDGGLQALNSKLYGKDGVQSTLETLRNTTYKLLDLGDSHFVKENFIERLGSYINAQGIKNLDDIPQEAIRTAWEEAMKATYKDNSWAYQMLKGFRGGFEKIPGIGKYVGQAAIPFLQAPGNIAARMVDYSPLGAGKGVADIISGTKANNLDQVRKGIDEFSKGATGSGMVVLGMKLRESGVITGDYSDDPDQKAQQKREGFKPFALHIGDRYYAYDWAQPMAEPLIIGTLLQETIEDSDKYDSEILKALGYEGTGAGKAVGALKAGGKASLNSWFNASPLQGLADLLGGDSTNGETDIAQNIFDTTIGDFAGSFIPSVVNATAKTMDTTQRNTYDPNNKFKTFLNQQQAKLPGLSKNLPAQYDTWGNEIKYADGTGTIPFTNIPIENENVEAGLQRYAFPGDYGIDRHDAIDEEINRLFEATGNNGVFAPKASYKVGDMTLDNEQNSIYQQDMGQRNRELVEEFIDSDLYESLSDEDRAETLKNMYNISRAITERDKFDKEISDSSSYKDAIEAYDRNGASGLIDYYEEKNHKSKVKDAMGSTSEWATELYDSGDKDRIKDYKNAQRIAKQYGTKNISEEQFLKYEKYGEVDFRQDLIYNQEAKKLGVSNNETFRNLYDSNVDPKYIKQAYKDITSVKCGTDEYDRDKYLEFNQTAYDIYDRYGEQGIQDYADIKAAGGGKDTYNSFMLYSQRQPQYSSQIPALDAKQYMQQVDTIEQSYFRNHPDKDGNPNGEVSMTELLDYMTKNNFTQDLAQKYWNSFFDNGYTVSKTKNGKYHYTNPNKKKK